MHSSNLPASSPTTPFLLPELKQVVDAELKADPHGHLCLHYIGTDGKRYALQVPLDHAMVMTNLLWTTIADLSA